MYNIIIADDDRLIREDVRTMVDWSRLGCRVTAEADDGAQALELVRRGNVDIVLTDIYMPVMDGVELIRQVKADDPHVCCLVMSNYDDFEYVKEAMKHGAIDYVLKYKLDKPTLSGLIRQATERIGRERAERRRHERSLAIGEKGKDSLREAFWRDLFAGVLDERAIAGAVRDLEIALPGQAWVPIGLDTDLSPERLEEELRREWPGMPPVAVRVGPRRTIAILGCEQKSYLHAQNESFEYARQLYGRLERQGERILLLRGDVCQKWAELGKQGVRLNQAFEAAFYDGCQGVRETLRGAEFGARLEESQLDASEQALWNAIQMNRADEAQSALTDWFAALRRQRPHPGEAQAYVALFATQLGKHLKKQGGSAEAVNGPGVLSGESGPAGLHQIETTLQAAVERTLKQAPASGGGYRSEIIKAIVYLETNFRQEISLNDVADHVGLSKNHFCKLFKQETGENFVNYLNRLRIERSKLMLLQPEASVKQIAVQVGMGNYRYFCKMFKSLTGKRPMDFKNEQLRMIR